MFQSPQWGKCSKASVEAIKAGKESFQSPQWGKCSKVNIMLSFDYSTKGFSPRNGESVLKMLQLKEQFLFIKFQSPQWGKCSKVQAILPKEISLSFQSPQWGKCSKGKKDMLDL